jgi:glycosyltransferase involved in cell wall biosynthesis
MSELIRVRHEDTHAFLDAANIVVAVAEWVRTLLIANGVEPEKLLHCPQGVGAVLTDSRRESLNVHHDNRPLRAIMLGRLDPMKGMHLPLAALERRRDLRISVDIYGVVQAEDNYVASVRRRVAADPRLRLLPAISPKDVLNVISAYDLMLIPSQWPETGPLVLLEAQAAGVPVIGTHLGGISERIRDDVDGQLVELGSVTAWERVLQRVVQDRSIARRWRAAVLPPRTMGDVAEQMNAVYHRVARSQTQTSIST